MPIPSVRILLDIWLRDDIKMGMFDTIYDVPVKCPRCGDEGPKSVQIKSGPQNLFEYEFGKDKIKIDWTYEYYGSIIDEDKRIIRGITICDKCKKETNKKMDDIRCQEKGKIKAPEGLKRLDGIHDGDRDIELFEVAIWLNEKNIPIAVDQIESWM